MNWQVVICAAGATVTLGTILANRRAGIPVGPGWWILGACIVVGALNLIYR